MPGDPVRELMAAHQGLCERATHPLEIAAALEEAGIGAAAAGRYRHGDVFSLAEELFARVPRSPADPPSGGVLPGRLGLFGAPVRPAGGVRPGPAGRLGHRLGLLGALAASLTGPFLLGPGPAGPAGGRAAAVALTVAATAATVPAEWSARWLRHAGQVQLRTADSLAGFRAGMRPVLPVALGLQLAALAALSFAALAVLTVLAPRPGPGPLFPAVLERADPAQWCAQAALGLLFTLAAVLRRSGRPRAARTGLLAVAPAAVAAAALRSAGLLPGWAGAPGAALALAAGATAALLLPYTWTVLGRPGAHR